MLSDYSAGGGKFLSLEKTLALFRKTAKRLICLYLLYSAVYFPFVVAGWVRNGFGVEQALRYVYQFFMVGSYSTIWYLLASVVALTASYFCFIKLGENKTLILSVTFYVFGVLISEFHNFVCQVPVIEAAVNLYETIFGGVKNGIVFGFIYYSIGAVLAKKQISGEREERLICLKMGMSFLLVCVEAVLQYVLGYATHGVDLKFSLVPFSYYFVKLLLCFEEKYGKSEFILKNKRVWKHLRDLSILLFLLQRIPLTLLESWKINSILYTIVILGLTVLLSEVVILLSKRFKTIKLY